MSSHKHGSRFVRLIALVVVVSALMMLVAPALGYAAPGAGTVVVSLRPSTVVDVQVDQVFTLDLLISAGQQPVGSIEASIQFPSAYLVVVDGAGNPASVIEPVTTTFPNLGPGGVDNAAGTINFSSAKYAGSATGEFSVAKIRFKVKTVVPAEGIAVTLTGTDVFLVGESVLGELQGATVKGPAPIPTPTPAFSGTPLVGTGPLTVNFTDQSTGCTVTSWAWNFGDGATSTQKNPAHPYAAVTSTTKYPVSLTVSCGGTPDTETKTDYITVIPAPIPTPDAKFAATPLSGIGPLAVNFTDQSTGCTVTSWAWNFGDNATSTQKNPTHTYAAVTRTQKYPVSLTVSCGGSPDTETKANYITVNPVPPTPGPSEVPEPGTLILLSGGLAGLAGYLRLRRKHG